MLIYARGSAVIEHADSGEEFYIGTDELDWEIVETKQRNLGRETIYQAEVYHDDLGDLIWTVSEYPDGAEGIIDTDVGEHEVVEDFDFGLEDGPEITEEDLPDLPDRLRRERLWAGALTKSTIVMYLLEWFHHFYEDPANETSHESREGGFQYLKGGPYFAEEELRAEFEGIVSEQAIMEAVQELQSMGPEWAPSPRHPDSIAFHEDGDAIWGKPDPFPFERLEELAAGGAKRNLGSAEELAIRSGILEQIAALRAELPKPPSHGGFGHNQPPEELEMSEADIDRTKETLTSIEKELASSEPDVELVAKQASFLKGVVSWAAGKLDKTLDEFCKAFGSTLGKAAGVAIPVLPFWQQLVGLLGGLKDWLLLALGV